MAASGAAGEPSLTRARDSGYDAAERRAIRTAIVESAAAACPVCGVTLDVRPVEAPRAVSYVRHRVWVLCPGCRRSAAIDLPARRSGGPT